MSVQTPWGTSHGSRELFPGAVLYHTAGHGGIWLNPERMEEFRRVFVEFETFAGGPWFEEDQDAAVVVLAFAQHFTDQEVRGAVVTARYSAKPFNLARPGEPERLQRYPKWELVMEWFQRDQRGMEAFMRASRFETSVRDMYERGGMASTDQRGVWWVLLKRVRDGERVECHMSLDEAYSKQFFTHDEVEARRCRRDHLACHASGPAL